MTLADLLADLFPGNESWTVARGLVAGRGVLADGAEVNVVGIAQGEELGVDGVVTIAKRVLEIARSPDAAPILVLVDSGGQRMSKRDELLGLNEYLAHLAKSLMLADRKGHRTIGLLYGGSAAGAFIATALATSLLVALPEAYPRVMDLPAMARVTKLPIEMLQEKSRSTAVFAPGLDNMIKVGAILEPWGPGKSLSARLSALLSTPRNAHDERDLLGESRKGRPKAARVGAEVAQLASNDG